MKPVKTLCIIFLSFLLLFALFGCGGGGGGDGSEAPPPQPVSVTITGTVDDGTPDSPIGNAICRFEPQGAEPRIFNADANAMFRFSLDPNIQGFLLCHPPALPKLILSTFISTEGRAPGETITEDVTPASSIVAELVKQVPPAARQSRENELLTNLDARESNITILVEAATILYEPLLTTQTNVDFAEGEGDGGGDDGGEGDGGGDDGGAEGDAGDGADASPIPGAICDFALTLHGETLVRSVLGDLFDNGNLERPDLQSIAGQVPIADPDALANAFNTLFLGTISHPLSDIADDASKATPGRYKLRIPPDVPGFVRCSPPSQQQLRIATFVPARQLNETLFEQHVTPQTTLFSTSIVGPLDNNLAKAKEDFLNDLMGLSVAIIKENGAVTGFEIVAPEGVVDTNASLVAFAATALFNSFFQNQIDVDYLEALADFIPKKGVDPAFLETLGVPIDQVENVAASVNTSTDRAEAELGTTLEEAVTTAHITVKVIDAASGVGIPGVIVDIVDDNNGIQCDENDPCPKITDEDGEARLTLSNVPEIPTDITLETVAEGFGTTMTTIEVAAFTTVSTEVSLGSGFVLTVAPAGEGTGSGTVTSIPRGINCTISSGQTQGTCDALFAEGANVELTATASPGSEFVAWSGACTEAPCLVHMNQPSTVTATFLALPAPSASNSFIDACPAVIIPSTIGNPVTSEITVAVRDDSDNPMPNADVVLSGSPGEFGSNSLVTGSDGKASTTFWSSTTGQKAFEAVLTANGTPTTISEANDIYVDEVNSFSLVVISGNNQVIPVGGTPEPLIVRVEDNGLPINDIPVSWTFPGNCFWQLSGAQNPEGESRAIFATTGPTTFQVTAFIQSDLAAPVTFTITIFDPASPVQFQGSSGVSRLRGWPNGTLGNRTNR